MSHGPVEQKHRELMNTLAKAIDDVFNPGWDKGNERTVGFALLVYNLGEKIQGTGRVNYVGNGKREDVLVALKELVARWEGRHIETGTPQ